MSYPDQSNTEIKIKYKTYPFARLYQCIYLLVSLQTVTNETGVASYFFGHNSNNTTSCLRHHGVLHVRRGGRQSLNKINNILNDRCICSR